MILPKNTNRRLYRLLFITLMLCVILFAQGSRLGSLEMNPDEVWSIWQSFGTPAQIIDWTPYDWTPLYYLLLGAWRILTGIHPVTLQWLSVMLSLIGAAFAYRAGKQLGGHWAGVFSALIYSGLSYSTFLSGYVRPYALAHALIPAAFSLTLSYFHKPTLIRAGMLILCLAAAFYTTLVIPVAIAFIGIYTLITTQLTRATRLWIPIALGFGVLCIPIFMTRFGLVGNRAEAEPLAPLDQAFTALFADYFGDAALVWIGVFILAGVMLVFRANGITRRKGIGLALWGFFSLILMYFLHPQLGFFRPSYSFWALTGMAFFGGLMLSRAPKRATILLVPALIALLFVPVPPRVALNYAQPGVSVFSWLREQVRQGDVILLDPHFDCLMPYELDYFVRAYFPEGLQFVASVEVSSLEGYQRVWYAANANTQDQALLAQLSENRVAGRFVGTPTCLWRVYEAPPNPAGIAFENGMRLHGVDVLEGAFPRTHPLALREGESIHLRLWWALDEGQTADYSIGVFVLDEAGNIVVQTDSAPQVSDAPRETSQWETGRFYVENRVLTLPDPPLASGNYRVVVTVYQWWDNVRIPAEGADENNLIEVLQFSVKAW